MKLDAFERQKIIKRIRKLKQYPYFYGEKLVGSNIWSLKVGRSAYRILYEIDEIKGEVTIVSIGRRKNIYNNL
ncbi:type II toxin-antitoxin system RelE/ParE family toxin [Candidatus Undinarchaeota archaeon]